MVLTSRMLSLAGLLFLLTGCSGGGGGHPTSGSIDPAGSPNNQDGGLQNFSIAQAPISFGDEHVIGQWDLHIDRKSLQAWAEPVNMRWGQLAGDITDVDAAPFHEGIDRDFAEMFEITGIPTVDDEGNITLSWSHTNPWDGPETLDEEEGKAGSHLSADPFTEANRADNAYTGRMVFLTPLTLTGAQTPDEGDCQSAGDFTFSFGSQLGGTVPAMTIVANTEAVLQPDGYVALPIDGASGLLWQGAEEYREQGAPATSNTNTFPYMLLADEDLDNRDDPSNGSNPLGNFDRDNFGWEFDDIGGDGGPVQWTGFDVVHHGQTVNNTVTFSSQFFNNLPGNDWTIRVAIIIKWHQVTTQFTDDGNTVQWFFPGDNVGLDDGPYGDNDLSKWAYRMPHGALDVSKVTGLPERVYIDAHANDTDDFTMLIRDWDEEGTELAPLTALSSETAFDDADMIAKNAKGAPTMIDVEAPGVPFAVSDPDGTNDGGDGLPGTEWEYDFSISRTTSVSATADNATAMFRIVDPEFFIDRENLRNEADDGDTDDQYNQVGVRHDDSDVTPTGNPFNFIDHASSLPPITFQALKIRTGSAPRPIDVDFTGTANCGNDLTFTVDLDTSTDAPTSSGGTVTFDWKFFDDATSCPAPTTRDTVGWASPVTSTSSSPTVKLLRCESTASDGLLRGSVQITKTISAVAHLSEKFFFTVDPALGVSTPTFTSTNTVFTQDYNDATNNSFAAMALIPSSSLNPNSAPTTDFASEYAIVFRDNTSSTHSALKVTIYDPVNNNIESGFPVTIANTDTTEVFGDISIDTCTHGIIIAWIDASSGGVEGVLGRWPLTQANAFTAATSLSVNSSGQIRCALRKGTNTDWAIAFRKTSTSDAAIAMGSPTWASPPSWGTVTTSTPSTSGDVGEFPSVCEAEGNKWIFAYRDNTGDDLLCAIANGTSPSSTFTAHKILDHTGGNEDGKDYSIANLGAQIGIAFRSGDVSSATLKLVVTNPTGTDPDDPAATGDWLSAFTIDDPASETTGITPHLSMVDGRPVIVYQQANSDLSNSDLRIARACTVPLVASSGQWTLATVVSDGSGSADNMGMGPMVFGFSTSQFGILHHILNDSDTGTVQIRRSSAGW